MALSDLAVFNEYTYTAMTEVLQQQIDLFNAATGGAIVLTSAAHQGDFSDTAFYAKIQDLVRRRNVYGNGALQTKTLEHLIDTSVKVAAGTPPVQMDPAWWNWIQRSPEEAGAIYGQQLARDSLADMLNTGILAYVAATLPQTEVVTDVSGTGGASLGTLLTGASKMGDMSSNIRVWVAHSKVMFDIWGQALTNNERLFSFGSVNIASDGFGRPIVLTDSPSLLVEGSPNKYHTAGLSAGAIYIGQNDDFEQNTDTSNGFENIKRTIQSEWSYNTGIKGYAWDKTSGGKSPNDQALASSANWDRVVTSHKDLAGVLVTSQ